MCNRITIRYRKISGAASFHICGMSNEANSDDRSMQRNVLEYASGFLRSYANYVRILYLAVATPVYPICCATVCCSYFFGYCLRHVAGCRVSLVGDDVSHGSAFSDGRSDAHQLQSPVSFGAE